MHFGHGNKEFQYHMDWQIVETDSEDSDLGVQITVGLKPSKQCQLAYSRFMSQKKSWVWLEKSFIQESWCHASFVQIASSTTP